MIIPAIPGHDPDVPPGVFDPEKYSDDDLQYIKTVLGSMSARTIWRGFYSVNNYSMPSGLIRTGALVEICSTDSK